jgi:ubiquinone/menaquinone biosynthesis C-methylase UbiE
VTSAEIADSFDQGPSSTAHFVDVTEISGDEVSAEQVERMCHRYLWAAEYCRGKDVVEAACGTGQGLGHLASLARSVSAGDYAAEILAVAQRHYGERIAMTTFDAADMPYPDASVDVVILFEALYYLPSADRFVEECLRVLRPGGAILTATANKDLYDFNASPHSHRSVGVRELNELFSAHGLSVDCFGFMKTDEISVRQKILRPIKKLAVQFDLIPETMRAKKILKRLVFGKLVPMPAEISQDMIDYVAPAPIPHDRPDGSHKVIYCVATRP